MDGKCQNPSDRPLGTPIPRNRASAAHRISKERWMVKEAGSSQRKPLPSKQLKAFWMELLCIAANREWQLLHILYRV